MKPFNIFRPFIITAILTLAFISAANIVNADDHKNGKGHKNNHHSEYRERGNYGHHYNNRDERGKGHNKHFREYKAYKYGNNDCYNHPKYGRVYSRFEHKPYILRHSHGSYYYSDNRFYTYLDGVGYCVAEPPRHVYFRELPFHCTRVYSNGREYYRNGDLFFSLSARGYVIVPAPVEFSVSVRF